MSTPYESEVAAVSGIDESGRVAQYSYQTWRDKQPYPVVPADYAGTADLFKWGGAQPGTGATITLLVRPGLQLGHRRAQRFRRRHGAVVGGRQCRDQGGDGRR